MVHERVSAVSLGCLSAHSLMPLFDSAPTGTANAVGMEVWSTVVDDVTSENGLKVCATDSAHTPCQMGPYLRDFSNRTRDMGKAHSDVREILRAKSGRMASWW